MTLRAFVLDDEPLAVQRMRRLLDATGRVEVIGSETNPVQAVEAVRSLAPDVLFLDIQMPVLNGFAFLEQLGVDLPVIFTTAFDQYAIDAFGVMSIDYLLKPVEPERLLKALDKLERLAGSPAPDVKALAKALAGQLSPARRFERVASRVGERTTLIEVARVSHFFARDKLSYAVSGGREHVIDQTLAQLEEKLDARRFVRIHRATIVNLGFVQELHPSVDGGVLARLRDEARTELSVARDRVRELKERLGI